MKKFSVFLLVAASLSLFGCHRNYKVNYARVPVDSTINHNIDSVDEMDNYDAEPLFQDAQFEGDVEDMDQARREYRKYINGTGN
jgi:hypothetical protein